MTSDRFQTTTIQQHRFGDDVNFRRRRTMGKGLTNEVFEVIEVISLPLSPDQSLTDLLTHSLTMTSMTSFVFRCSRIGLHQLHSSSCHSTKNLRNLPVPAALASHSTAFELTTAILDLSTRIRKSARPTQVQFCHMGAARDTFTGRFS